MGLVWKDDPKTVSEVERLLKSTSQEDRTVRAALVSALATKRNNEDPLWRWIVVGILVLATLALAGLLVLIADGNPATAPELALTAFVGLLSGLFGLLMGAPWRQTGG
jgi:hypothetical protein